MTFGCSGNDPSVTVLDLLATLDLAEKYFELSEIDLGSQQARAALAHGWSKRAVGRNGRTFLWSRGLESAVNFFLVSRRDLTLDIRGRARRRNHHEPLTVTALINGEEMFSFVVATRWKVYRVKISAVLLRVGENRLTLRYSSGLSEPSQLPGPEQAERLVAWDWFRFSPMAPLDANTSQEGEGLRLPFGARLDFYFKPTDPSRFALDALELLGNNRGELTWTVTSDSGELARGRLSAKGEVHNSNLEWGAEPVRLSLAAIPSKAGESGGLLLKSPRVLGAPQSQQGPAQAVRSDRTDQSVRPHLLIYLVDTLRADGLGCYGYKKAVTPNIDAFANEAVLFENAVAQASWTRPAVVSLFTGKWPLSHGVNGRRDSLSGEANTLAEVLSRAGYATIAVVDQPNISARFGLGQGFETYQLRPRSPAGVDNLNRAFESWLVNRAPGDRRPLFLYMHTVEPHSPYSPRSPYRERFATALQHPDAGSRSFLKRVKTGRIETTPDLVVELKQLYAAEIAASDANFGKFVEILKRENLYENSVIWFLSDHGEEFSEHGHWEHGKSLHTEVVDVPLIVRFPEYLGGQRVASPVQQIDILPTILDYLALELPSEVEGQSLLPLLNGSTLSTVEVERELYSYLDLGGFQAAAVTTTDWRLIRLGPLEGEGRVRLYSRRIDRAERTDASKENPIQTGYLLSLLNRARRSRYKSLAGGDVTLDRELKERLQALGYID